MAEEAARRELQSTRWVSYSKMVWGT
jgi:hypothetical protein